MSAPATSTALVADIGGTNTRVALAQGRALVPGSVRRYPNADHADLEGALARYLDEMDLSPSFAGACVAAAGPVRDGRIEITNLDWTIDPDAVASVTGARTVAILNDLQAQGHAIGHVSPSLVTIVREGAGDGTTRLVIGVGTGFNAAPVFDTDHGREVPPSESGHATMAIGSAADAALFAYLEARDDGFASTESALSGPGLEHLYGWTTAEAGAERKLSAAAIMQACADGSDPQAREAVRHFVRLLGVEAGDLALRYLPFGGIFLTGGVARAVLPYLDATFEAAFLDKGRFGPFMRAFPVSVVCDDYAALVGCAAHLDHRLP
jgi:glucokinase